MLLRTYWRWTSIILLGVALNYVVNKVFDLRYGARSSFNLKEVIMAILFSYAILEGSRWVRSKLHASQKQIANTPLSLFTYPTIFLYITFIILGVGNLMNIVFFGGANQGDENFIVLLLTLFFSFPVLAIDYLWKYKAQLEEVNDQLQSKQEELIQFRKDNHSKTIIEASHGVQKVLVTPDQILMIYRDTTIVYIVNREYKKLITNHSLDALEELLPSNEFCRANRQFILTPYIIRSIKSGSYGKIELQLNANNNLPSAVTISRPSAAGFRRWLNASTDALAK